MVLSFLFSLTLRIFILLIVSLHVCGCAVYYRDRESGAEHIWGIGHLAMKVAPTSNEKQALIQRTTLPGLALGLDNGELGISIGWAQREHIFIYDDSTALTIDRPPSNDFFEFKIGSYPAKTSVDTALKDSLEYKEDHP